MQEDLNDKYQTYDKRGRPFSENPKNKQYRLRMDDEETKKLEYCVKALGLTKAEVIRQGIEEMYQKALNKK